MGNEPKYELYCHTNLVNGKIYFGVTSRGWEARWCDNQYRHNEALYNDIRKYGSECWAHDVIRSGMDAEEAAAYEAVYIEFFDARNSDIGYNLMSGGGGLKLHEDDDCIKISDSMIERWRDPEFRASISKKRPPRTEEQKERARQNNEKYGRAVLCIETGEVYASIRETARLLGCDTKNLKTAIRNGYACRGYHFQIIGEVLSNCRVVMCIETGAEYETITIASQETGISKSGICGACNGNRKTAGGFHWKYV